MLPDIVINQYIEKLCQLENGPRIIEKLSTNEVKEVYDQLNHEKYVDLLQKTAIRRLLRERLHDDKVIKILKAPYARGIFKRLSLIGLERIHQTLLKPGRWDEYANKNKLINRLELMISDRLIGEMMYSDNVEDIVMNLSSYEIERIQQRFKKEDYSNFFDIQVK